MSFPQDTITPHAGYRGDSTFVNEPLDDRFGKRDEKHALDEGYTVGVSPSYPIDCVGLLISMDRPSTKRRCSRTPSL